jgi:nitroimidazol reductase NimA-like FMN-containing flavoprotein (pyridoxamine 5'-phosphate oxidase superfamily)
MERLLEKYSIGRLGLTFQNESYIVPVTYKYDQGRVFFHSAKQGKKVDFIKNNSRVCFEVDEYEKGWASVICYGTLTLREDIEAKKEFAEVFLGQKPSDELLKRMQYYIGIVQIEDMTGKCSADFSF